MQLSWINIGQVARMTTLTVRLKRRHHQPQMRRFREVRHLLGPYSFRETYKVQLSPDPQGSGGDTHREIVTLGPTSSENYDAYI